jgi:hypothetical protein
MKASFPRPVLEHPLIIAATSPIPPAISMVLIIIAFLLVFPIGHNHTREQGVGRDAA